jgi:hypothetical protein
MEEDRYSTWWLVVYEPRPSMFEKFDVVFYMDLPHVEYSPS